MTDDLGVPWARRPAEGDRDTRCPPLPRYEDLFPEAAQNTAPVTEPLDLPLPAARLTASPLNAAPALFVFEGPRGSGRTTQARLFAQALCDAGASDVVETQEPTDYPSGRALKAYLAGEANPDPKKQLELTLADRRVHLELVVKPALARRALVVQVGSSLSTMVELGPSLGLSEIDAAHRDLGEPSQDLVFVLGWLGHHAPGWNGNQVAYRTALHKFSVLALASSGRRRRVFWSHRGLETSATETAAKHVGIAQQAGLWPTGSALAERVNRADSHPGWGRNEEGVYVRIESLSGVPESTRHRPDEEPEPDEETLARLEERDALGARYPRDGRVVEIVYTNWKGETATRRILPDPAGFRFGSTRWHPELQWLLDARDIVKNVDRTFSVAGIKGWRSLKGPAQAPCTDPIEPEDSEHARSD